MLVQVGFRPNNLFISSSTKHHTLTSPSYVQMSHPQHHNNNNNNNNNNTTTTNHHSHHHHHGKHDFKHFQAFLNCRKKKMKRSVLVPGTESVDGNRGAPVGGGGGGGGSGGLDNKTPISKCLDTIENDLRALGRHQSLNPFKNLKIRKEGGGGGGGGGLAKGKATSRTVENGDGSASASSTRLAVEFPMILNVGSIYSSHVVLYLDP